MKFLSENNYKVKLFITKYVKYVDDLHLISYHSLYNNPYLCQRPSSYSSCWTCSTQQTSACFPEFFSSCVACEMDRWNCSCCRCCTDSEGALLSV